MKLEIPYLVVQASQDPLDGLDSREYLETLEDPGAQGVLETWVFQESEGTLAKTDSGAWLEKVGQMGSLDLMERRVKQGLMDYKGTLEQWEFQEEMEKMEDVDPLDRKGPKGPKDLLEVLDLMEYPVLSDLR